MATYTITLVLVVLAATIAIISYRHSKPLATKWSEGRNLTFTFNVTFVFPDFKYWIRVVRKLITHLRSPTTSATPSTLTEFTLFSKLPLELRQMVWEKECHRSRVISVIYNATYGFHIISNTPPALLHVNSEAREMGLRFYSLTSMQDSQWQTYVNLKVDIIYLRRSTSLKSQAHYDAAWDTYWVDDDWLANVEHLALPIKNHHFIHGLLKPVEAHIPKLRNLILIDEPRVPVEEGSQYLIPLEGIDAIPDGESGKIRDVTSFLGLIHRDIGELHNDIRTEAEFTGENVDWMRNFSPVMSVMQLRNPYRDGVEGVTKTLRTSDKSIGTLKPIYLGDLRRVDGVWDIVRR